MTKTLELLQPPQQEGAPVEKVYAAIEHICFAFKQPLQPVFIVNAGGAMLPCLGDYAATLETLEKCGFAVLETTESSRAAVNPAKVVFYTSQELGIYNLVFPGKAVMSVKSTISEIEGLFEKSLIIQP